MSSKTTNKSEINRDNHYQDNHHHGHIHSEESQRKVINRLSRIEYDHDDDYLDDDYLDDDYLC